MESNIAKNYKNLKLNIFNICKKINRNPSEINIVAVSKKQNKSKIEELLKYNHNCYGENILQEAQDKWSIIRNDKITLHYIGALQSKKVQDILNSFNVIETLDTESSANKIARYIVKNPNKKKAKIYMQINIGEEPQKRGVPILDVGHFIKMCKERYNIKIDGAMCLPPISSNAKYFKLMNEICFNNNIHDISMGMSNDYAEAIKYGSTNIRIGTSIFGKRKS